MIIRNAPQVIGALTIAGLGLAALMKFMHFSMKTCRVPWNTIRDWASWILAIGAIDSDIPSDTIRPALTGADLTAVKSFDGAHTHPVSASFRSVVNDAMTTIAEVAGRQAYYYQKSAADVRHNHAGSRSYYWVKDLNVDPEPFNPVTELGDKCILCVVDVDMYMDMPTFISDNFQPYLLYTVQPSVVARNTKEYAFTFNENNEMVYKVTGGGSFTHMVWNYSVDNIFVETKFMGVAMHAASYLVDRRYIDDDHAIVLLSPLKEWHFPYSIVASYTLGGRTLERLKPVVDKFLRMQVHKTDGMYMSTGKVNEYICANTKSEIDSCLRIVTERGKLELSLPAVRSYYDEKDKAPVLVDYHRSQIADKPPYVTKPEEAIITYQYDLDKFDPEAKPLVEPFMPPLINGGCYVPMNTESNEIACHKYRILKARTRTRVTPWLKQRMIEYINFIVTKKHRHQLDPFGLHDCSKFEVEPGHMFPTDDEDVADRQDRPSQKRIIEEASWMAQAGERAEMFLKKEPYAKVTPPRPINVGDGVTKVEYSKFMYTAAEYLKTQKWYAFGLTPKAVAAKVALICLRAKYGIALTDLSKWDGHVSEVFRELERMYMDALFLITYHNVLKELMGRQYNRFIVGMLGLRYWSELERLSGSPETACFNSLDNGFIAYLALYLDLNNAELAFEQMGIYGGDDGLTPDVSEQSYKKACTMIGQDLTWTYVKKGAYGVKFLARVYVQDVWYGNENSTCDLARQLSKLHVSVKLPTTVSPLDKCLVKLENLRLTDPNTPVIQDLLYVAGCLTAYSDDEGEDHENPIEQRSLLPYVHIDDQYILQLTSYWARFEATVQYPNELSQTDRANIINLTFGQSHPYDLIFTWSQNTVDEFVSKNQHTKVITDALLHMPTIFEFEEKIVAPAEENIVVGDDVIEGKDHLYPDDKPTNIEAELVSNTVKPDVAVSSNIVLKPQSSTPIQGDASGRRSNARGPRVATSPPPQPAKRGRGGKRGRGRNESRNIDPPSTTSRTTTAISTVSEQTDRKSVV